MVRFSFINKRDSNMKTESPLVLSINQEYSNLLSRCGRPNTTKFHSAFIDCFSTFVSFLPKLTSCSQEEISSVSDCYYDVFDKVFIFHSFWEHSNDGACSKPAMRKRAECELLYAQVLSILQPNTSQLFNESLEAVVALDLYELVKKMLGAYQIEIPFHSFEEKHLAGESLPLESAGSKPAIMRSVSVDEIGGFTMSSSTAPHFFQCGTSEIELLDPLGPTQNGGPALPQALPASKRNPKKRKPQADHQKSTQGSASHAKRSRKIGSSLPTRTPSPKTRQSFQIDRLSIEAGQVAQNANLFVFSCQAEFESSVASFDSPFDWVSNFVDVISRYNFELKSTVNVEEQSRCLRVLNGYGKVSANVKSLEDLARQQIGLIKKNLKCVNNDAEALAITGLIDKLEALEACSEIDSYEDKVPTLMAFRFFPLIPTLKEILQTRSASFNSRITLTSPSMLSGALNFINGGNYSMWLVVWANALYKGAFSLETDAPESLLVHKGDSIKTMNLSDSKNHSLESLVSDAVHFASIDQIDPVSDLPLVQETMAIKRPLLPDCLNGIATQLDSFLQSLSLSLPDTQEEPFLDTDAAHVLCSLFNASVPPAAVQPPSRQNSVEIVCPITIVNNNSAFLDSSLLHSEDSLGQQATEANPPFSVTATITASFPSSFGN